MNQENNQKPNTANAQSPISKEKISFQVREKTEAVKLFIESLQENYYFFIININFREIYKTKAK